MFDIPDVIDIPETAEERVQLAVTFLDEHFPGWEGYINRLTLTVSRGSCCILGQLAQEMPAFADCRATTFWNSYHDAVNWLLPGAGSGARDLWGVAHGFVDGGGVGYSGLQFAWECELDRRQARFAVLPGSTPEPVPMTDAEDEAFRDQYERRLDGE